MFWVVVTVLWAAMLVSPLVLFYLFLPSGRGCPRCASETLSIRSRVLWPVHRIVALRWCLSCGWQGVVKQTGVRPAPAVEVLADEVEEADDDAPWRPR